MKFILEIDPNESKNSIKTDIQVTIVGPIVKKIINTEFPIFEFDNISDTLSPVGITPVSIHSDIGSAIVFTRILEKKHDILTFGDLKVIQDDNELDKFGYPVLKIRRKVK